MQTRREYAIGLGLAKPTRGRMSREANEAINKAIAEGMQFSDMPGVKSEDSPKADKETPKEKPESYFGSTPAPIYNGGWNVIVKGKRVTISGREVCRSCMISLDYHRCDSPIVPNINTGAMMAVVR